MCLLTFECSRPPPEIIERMSGPVERARCVAISGLYERPMKKFPNGGNANSEDSPALHHWHPKCRQSGNYPQTGLEYINANLLEADFWTMLLRFTQPSLEMVLRLAEALEVPLKRIEAAQRARWAKIRASEPTVPPPTRSDGRRYCLRQLRV